VSERGKPLRRITQLASSAPTPAGSPAARSLPSAVGGCGGLLAREPWPADKGGLSAKSRLASAHGALGARLASAIPRKKQRPRPHPRPPPPRSGGGSRGGDPCNCSWSVNCLVEAKRFHSNQTVTRVDNDRPPRARPRHACRAPYPALWVGVVDFSQGDPGPLRSEVSLRSRPAARLFTVRPQACHQIVATGTRCCGRG
jgi:hypothetical protein